MPRDLEKKRRRLFWLPVAVLAALILYRAWAGVARERADEPAEIAFQRVRTIEIGREPIRELLELSGTIAPENRVMVTARAFGPLETVMVEEADLVEKGRLLARIDERDYRLRLAEIEAALRSARLEKDNADRDYERTRTLHEKRDYRPRLAEIEAALRSAVVEEENARTTLMRLESLFRAEVATAQERDNARARFEAAAAAVIRLEAQAAQVRETVAEQEEIYSAREVDGARTRFEAAGAALERLQAQADQVRDSLAHTMIEAPVSGYVSRRFFDAGAEIGAGSGPLFEIINIDRVRLRLAAGETALARFRAGLPVEIRVDAMPETTFRGRVEKIMPDLDPATRSVAVEVILDNPGHRLRPGMFARARIEIERRDEALVLPREGFITVGGRHYAYVAEEGKARRREIETGLVEGEKFEVRSGLREGERVIVTDLEKLFEGAGIETVK